MPLKSNSEFTNYSYLFLLSICVVTYLGYYVIKKLKRTKNLINSVYLSKIVT